MLDDDLTRCRGEGNSGAVCPRRDQCDRFRAIAEDLVREERTGLRLFHSYAAMLCRPPQYAFFWPVEESS